MVQERVDRERQKQKIAKDKRLATTVTAAAKTKYWNRKL